MPMGRDGRVTTCSVLAQRYAGIHTRVRQLQAECLRWDAARLLAAQTCRCARLLDPVVSLGWVHHLTEIRMLCRMAGTR